MPLSSAMSHYTNNYLSKCNSKIRCNHKLSHKLLMNKQSSNNNSSSKISRRYKNNNKLKRKECKTKISNRFNNSIMINNNTIRIRWYLVSSNNKNPLEISSKKSLNFKAHQSKMGEPVLKSMKGIQIRRIKCLKK